LLSEEVVRVGSEERASTDDSSWRRQVFAVFDAGDLANPRDMERGFLGLVAKHDVLRFPQRIFADLLPRVSPSPLLPDLSLQDVVKRIDSAPDRTLPVLEADGRFVGAITTESVLVAQLSSRPGAMNRAVVPPPSSKLPQGSSNHGVESLGCLAAGVAHTLNNLLTIIMGHGERLETHLVQDREARKRVSEILKASHRGSRLADQLLASAKEQMFVPEQTDVNDVVSSVGRKIVGILGEKIHLERRLDSRLKAAWADPALLEQLLLNLADYARSIMYTGGTLTIRTANSPSGRVRSPGAEGSPPNGDVMLCVSETGSNLDDEAQARFFEPYFIARRTGSGTGFELAAVRGIVSRHGGSIAVERRRGGGATISIHLPRGMTPSAH
jgi:signal transduction histidine kinase